MGFPGRDRPSERDKRDGPRSRRSRDRDESPSSHRSRSRHRSTPSQDGHESADGDGRLRNASRDTSADYKNRPRRREHSGEREREREPRGRFRRSGSRSEGEDFHHRGGGRQEDGHRTFRPPPGRHRDDGERWGWGEQRRGGDWDREAGGSRRRSADREWAEPGRWGRGQEDNEDDVGGPYGDDRPPPERCAPSTTVILQGLSPDVTMEDIRPVVLQCGLTPKGVRVIKRRDTGASRGFAFVEFYALQDACRWMQLTQGVMELGGRCHVTMEFSAPREEQRNIMSGTMDWSCVKCGINNFERRKTCYKCMTPKEGEDTGEGHDEISYSPTKTLLLRGLDVLSTVESVMESMKAFKSVAIVSVRIGQDSLTNTSRGVCYVDMKTQSDSTLFHDALSQKPLVVDGRRVTVTYCKPTSEGSPGDPGQAWRSRRPEKDVGTSAYDLSRYSLEDVPRLAAYSASVYAGNPGELQSYTEYYRQYYQAQLAQLAAQPAVTSAAPQMHVKNLCQSDDVNAGAAVAQAAIQQSMAARDVRRAVVGATVGRLEKADEVCKMPVIKTPAPVVTTPQQVPDVSTYQYDMSSGHYYDPHTGLYYDPTSQYYFDAATRQYSYWDAGRGAYLPAPTAPAPAVVPPAAPSEEGAADPGRREGQGKKEKDKPENKVKVAKRIAKDMERWAKALNQKKENVSAVAATAAHHLSRKSVGAADAGFAVLSLRKEAPAEPQPPPQPQPQPPPATPRLVAAYEDASDDEIGDVEDEEARHTDWDKLACLLCKRQFDKRETLLKHQQVSSLHQQNVETWYRSRGLDPNDKGQRNDLYRDRAKERRLKFGQPNAPQPNRLKEKYLKIMEDAVVDSYEEPTRAGISSDNIGNRMLQKLGWKEGMGLGKANQGRTSIIQTKQRSATAGLGSKGSTYGALPGEAYKDSVKRAMFARYQELTDQEEGK